MFKHGINSPNVFLLFLEFNTFITGRCYAVSPPWHLMILHSESASMYTINAGPVAFGLKALLIAA